MEVATADNSPRRLARADREQQIVAVAHHAFATRGFGAVTMDEIAAEVGVTKPLLYAYFGNKDGLYRACMEPAAQALIETIAEAISGAGDAADALGRGVRAFFGFVDDDRDAWRVLFDETLPAGGEIEAVVAEHRSHINGLIADTMAGWLTPVQRRSEQSAVVIEALSVSVLAAAEALARWWLRTGALTARQAAELLIATVEPGLRRVAAADPGTADRDTTLKQNEDKSR